MALYNTSINNDGLRFLQQQKDLLSALAREVKRDTAGCELKLMALRLLQSLTCHIPSATVLIDMMKHVRTRTTLIPPSHVLMNFRGFPPGCGDSVADFSGWDATTLSQ